MEITTCRENPESPYPTTFVTADSSSFKQVVQFLTGSDLPHNPPSSSSAPIKKQKQGNKLYERRMKNINRLPELKDSTFKAPEILSPSFLNFPSLTLSPSEEERAIAGKGFYLHPSPMSTPRESEPQLLPLFPLTSPRASDPQI